jgi:predicted metal-binding membrane protein
MRVAAHRSLFLPLMGSLVVFAWATLWIWEQSPYGRYLNHGQWSDLSTIASLCRAVPGGEVIVPLVLYVGGWTLMSAAMMLPTTFPLLEAFRRLTARRDDRRRLVALLIGGYLAAWGLFGLVAHVADWLLLELLQTSDWLTFNGWAIGASVFALAGLFQFSSLKYRCLDKCRSPLSFVLEHWRGHNHAYYAARLGLRHGAYCVGCCWALMLLMFALGTGSLGWMLLLGGIMAVEKNMPWGRHLSAPLGTALVGVALWIVVEQSGLLSI